MAEEQHMNRVSDVPEGEGQSRGWDSAFNSLGVH